MLFSVGMGSFLGLDGADSAPPQREVLSQGLFAVADQYGCRD